MTAPAQMFAACSLMVRPLVLLLGPLTAACEPDSVALPETEQTDSPATVDDDVDSTRTPGGMQRLVRWASCVDSSSCQLDESCLLGPFYNVCARACAGSDECREPVEQPSLEQPVSIDCVQLEERSYCLRVCSDDPDCPQGMACHFGACVWR